MSAAIDTHRPTVRPRVPGTQTRGVEDPCDCAPIGVLLFNMGGPGTLDEVEPFLVNLYFQSRVGEESPLSVCERCLRAMIAEGKKEVLRRCGPNTGDR